MNFSTVGGNLSFIYNNEPNVEIKYRMPLGYA